MPEASSNDESDVKDILNLFTAKVDFLKGPLNLHSSSDAESVCLAQCGTSMKLRQRTESTMLSRFNLHTQEQTRRT